LSTIETLKEQFPRLPLASIAENQTVETPTGNEEPFEIELESPIVAPGQFSCNNGEGKVILAPQVAGSLKVCTRAGQERIGGLMSTTPTANEQLFSLPEWSRAPYDTKFVPTGNLEPLPRPLRRSG